MKVVIKEKLHDYESDYPDGWQFSSGDYFKFSVSIGNHSCFVKRFEIHPRKISGWELLNSLRHKFELCLPKIYDVVNVEEKSKQVHYVFYEQLHGSTLDKVNEAGNFIDLKRLTDNLFNAIESIKKYDYWFADFCEKNIFCEDTGRYLLLDLDSTQPLSKAPDNDMYGNKDYWALVFNFYKDVVGYKKIKLTDISGLSLTHLQVVFLILHLKIFNQDHQLEYMSSEAFNELPACLDNIDSAFSELFTKIYKDGKGSRHTYSVNEIKQLIAEKIIDQTVVYPAPVKKPVISRFESSSQEVRRGEPFSLDWEVRNASHVIIYKNGVEFQKVDASHQTMVITESSIDRRAKSIVYSLVAENGNDRTSSDPIGITFTEKVIEKTYDSAQLKPASDPEVGQTWEPPTPPLTKPPRKAVIYNEPGYKPPSTGRSKKGRYILLGLTIAVLTASGIIFIPREAKPNAEIVDFVPKKIYEGRSLIVTGRNFPKQVADLQVLFNNVPGTIHFKSDSFMRVSVPILGQHLGNGNVKVGLVIKKDTFYAGQDLIVQKLSQR